MFTVMAMSLGTYVVKPFFPTCHDPPEIPVKIVTILAMRKFNYIVVLLILFSALPYAINMLVPGLSVLSRGLDIRNKTFHASVSQTKISITFISLFHVSLYHDINLWLYNLFLIQKPLINQTSVTKYYENKRSPG